MSASCNANRCPARRKEDFAYRRRGRDKRTRERVSCAMQLPQATGLAREVETQEITRWRQREPRGQGCCESEGRAGARER